MVIYAVAILLYKYLGLKKMIVEAGLDSERRQRQIILG
jgi:hypothetical protein